MPTFDFKCLKCAAVFEFTRPFGSDIKPACPKCKSKRTEKLLGMPPAVHFKGSGWYKNDSRPAPKAEKETVAPVTPEVAKPTDKPAEKPADNKPTPEKKVDAKPATEKKPEPSKN